MSTDRHYSIHYSFIDQVCLGIDQAVRALCDNVMTTGQPYPAEKIEDVVLTPTQSEHSAAIMRVNHAGEICAQGLYHGQGIVSNSDRVQDKLKQAAIEEGDHLTWCRKRLDELNSHTSYLNPFWYAGSFCIGIIAGLIGDQWSLGFVAETERQVVSHLNNHINILPKEDQRSLQILKKMESDEAHHRDEAMALGAAHLPVIVKKAMAFSAKIMVKTSYWI
jgi:ubiquinone biosynthesis monooxygenase Coq7